MRVVFFGTPEVALPPLRAIAASAHELVGVVTQPDRPKGRSGSPLPPPVKLEAERLGVPALQPASPKDDGFAADLAALEPDACAVVAYGHLLPPAVLAVPPKGTVNVHFSLLPRYRGAAPVQHAIMHGDATTGISVFVLEPTLDTGPVVARTEVPIEPDDTTGSLLERLAPMGAAMLVEVLDALAAGTAAAVEQDDTAATPAPKITNDDARIDWTRPAHAIRDQVRALNPAPGAFTTFRGRRVKLWSAALAPGPSEPGAGEPGPEPGAVLPDGPTFAIATGDGALAPLEIQPEGKRRMSPEEFARGARLAPGDRFGA